MANVTQGRNDGRKNRVPTKATTMTSDSVSTVNKGTRRVTPAPTLYVKSQETRDILDTGLEDHTWHYVWVNKNDTVQVHGYYNNGYRFVKYSDVKEQLLRDERNEFLYNPDESDRVSYGDESRLMRIPQEVYKERLDFALNGGSFTAAEKATQLLTHTVEQGKYEGTMHRDVKVSQDEDSGQKETITTPETGGTK